MAKEMSPVVCGITGNVLTEWNQRTFINRYIDGKLQSIPLYLDVNEVLKLHKQSATYLERKAAQAQDNQAVYNKGIKQDTEVNETTTDTEEGNVPATPAVNVGTVEQ